MRKTVRCRVRPASDEPEHNNVRKSSDIVLSRNRDVFMHGVSEPFMNEGQQRKRAVEYHVINLLRSLETSDHVAIEMVLRLGRWQEDSE